MGWIFSATIPYFILIKTLTSTAPNICVLHFIKVFITWWKFDFTSIERRFLLELDTTSPILMLKIQCTGDRTFQACLNI